MTRRKQCPDCKKMFTWDDSPDGQKMFCKPCRLKYNAQNRSNSIRPTSTGPPKKKSYHPRRQNPSVVRKTIDSKDWKYVKQQIIARDGPVCQNHRRNGLDIAFSGQYLQLDHIVPQDVRPDLIWDLNNLEHLCVSCHAAKTREESGMSAATRRHGWPPLVIDWDVQKNVWAVSGHNARRVEIFKSVAGVETVISMEDLNEFLEEGHPIQPNTMILCTRQSQFEIGKRLQARFLQFMEGLNV